VGGARRHEEIDLQGGSFRALSGWTTEPRGGGGPSHSEEKGRKTVGKSGQIVHLQKVSYRQIYDWIGRQGKEKPSIRNIIQRTEEEALGRDEDYYKEENTR